jgi:hypothetical protein
MSAESHKVGDKIQVSMHGGLDTGTKSGCVDAKRDRH